MEMIEEIFIKGKIEDGFFINFIRNGFIIKIEDGEIFGDEDGIIIEIEMESEFGGGKIEGIDGELIGRGVIGISDIDWSNPLHEVMVAVKALEIIRVIGGGVGFMENFF